MAFQNKSFDEIAGFIKNKEVLLACTPAIQPVSNKDLNRIASGFGYRIDPVYKTVKMHAGLDFAAPQGTPIYATANGTVEVAEAAAELSEAGKLVSVAGGGDTVAALNVAGVAERLTYVSTAGGAFLEWLEGKALPGVEVLRVK